MRKLILALCLCTPPAAVLAAVMVAIPMVGHTAPATCTDLNRVVKFERDNLAFFRSIRRGLEINTPRGKLLSELDEIISDSEKFIEAMGRDGYPGYVVNPHLCDGAVPSAGTK